MPMQESSPRAPSSTSGRAATSSLTLLVREGCHLCDDMRDALDALREDLDLRWTEQDVDADAALRQRYDALVPVLLLGEREVCHHFLDAVALRAALRAPLTG